jgi:hypothetical protein
MFEYNDEFLEQRLRNMEGGMIFCWQVRLKLVLLELEDLRFDAGIDYIV